VPPLKGAQNRPKPRRDADATRARLLSAAQQAFAARGFGDVGLRAIAADAACDPALIARYFGSKEALFEAAIADLLDTEPLLAGGKEGFGRHVVEYFINRRNDRGDPLPMMIFSTADPVSRAITLRLLEERIIRPIGDWLDAGRGAELAARISILCSGFFLYWQILPLQALAGEVPQETQKWLAEQLQAIVDSV